MKAKPAIFATLLNILLISTGNGVLEIPNNNSNNSVKPNYLTYEQMNVMNQFRQLAMDFVTWDQAMANAIRFNNPNREATFQRLLKVPGDIYDTMTTFYGKPVAEQYTNLLTNQAITYTNLVEALSVNDFHKADEALRQWYQLAEEHATFYSKLSPYWSREQWRLLMYQFIGAIYYGVLALLSGDYVKSIEIFDYAYQFAVLMADYASAGLMLNLAVKPSIPATAK